MNGRLGATHLGDSRTRFCVWAPRARRVDVQLDDARGTTVALHPAEAGYHEGVVEGPGPGSRYYYCLDQAKKRPDPASRYQPLGVHGPSEVVDSAFGWEDHNWHGLSLDRYVLYELHVGVYTDQGTFDAIIPHLSALSSLGITAIELMPVAQFPGNRNWGYDGVCPFAVQASYGGGAGLKRLVNACHSRGLAVTLDVVYNHLGPEGNYLADFGPYFTDLHKTPWGAALNFDGAHSDEVRRFFIENALHWIEEFHVDALRLDATDAIFDASARTFLEELAGAVHERAAQLNRRVYLIAEDDRNDIRKITPREVGGYGLDACWNDDFHHALHAWLTGERDGYYEDFGSFGHLVKSFRDGFVYTGQYSRYRDRAHGTPSVGVPPCRLVVFSQNHDQVGNRMLGERLSRLVSSEELKLAAAAVLLSPYTPLLFMGEEYGETAPFQYFISHSDPDLIEAVRRGRAEEFRAFHSSGAAPDPQSEAVFEQCRLDHGLKSAPEHAPLYAFYSELLRVRAGLVDRGLLARDRIELEPRSGDDVLILRYGPEGDSAVVVFNFGKMDAALRLRIGDARPRYVLDSADARWRGPGAGMQVQDWRGWDGQVSIRPRSAILFDFGVEGHARGPAMSERVVA